MTEVFVKPCPDNIVNLYHLRESFKNYYGIVENNYKKDHVFYLNADDTNQKDDSLYLMGSRNQRIDLFTSRYSIEDFKKPSSYEAIIGNGIELHGRSKTLVEEILDIH